MSITIIYALGLAVIVIGVVVSVVADLLFGGLIVLAGALVAHFCAQRAGRENSGSDS